MYVEALTTRVVGARLESVRLGDPFLLRSVDPPIDACLGREVRGVERLGKRLIFALEGELFVVLHLMIAGRLQWGDGSAKPKARAPKAEFAFSRGTLALTEAGTQRRASLHVVKGRAGLRAHDRGGVEPLSTDLATFEATLTSESHTLKRSLTDPRLFAGIGNAYSDEILHRAQLSPLALSRSLDAAERARLFAATVDVLREWTARLRDQAGGEFPSKVTAFRPEMAVHGRYGQPCPVCASKVQRIVYASNECNYCARCQTQGRLLSDRALSRLLKDDWPRTIDELERREQG